jgi:hypothetical protein
VQVVSNKAARRGAFDLQNKVDDGLWGKTKRIALRGVDVLKGWCRHEIPVAGRTVLIKKIKNLCSESWEWFFPWCWANALDIRATEWK